MSRHNLTPLNYRTAAWTYILARSGRLLDECSDEWLDARIAELTLDEARGIEEARHSGQGIACLQVGKVLAAGRPVALSGEHR